MADGFLHVSLSPHLLVSLSGYSSRGQELGVDDADCGRLRNWSFARICGKLSRMSEQIDAIYDGGVLKPVVPLSLPDKARVTLTIDAASPPAAAISWRAFVERTYGSCADQGLERHDQGEFDPREPIA